MLALASIDERNQRAGVTCQGLYAQVLSGERLGGYLDQSASSEDSSRGLASAGPRFWLCSKLLTQASIACYIEPTIGGL